MTSKRTRSAAHHRVANVFLVLVGFIMVLHAVPALAETSAPPGSAVRIGGTTSSGRSAQSPPGAKSTLTESYTVSIASGSPDQTEFAAAYDIATALATGQETGAHGESFRVLPIANTGGLQSVRDVLSRRSVDLAIAPVGLLDVVLSRDEAKGLRDKLVYITELFNQELHVLALSETTQVTDLAGRTVNFGPQGSGADSLAREIFRRFEISVKEANLPLEDALEKMQAGEIAATIVLSGKPILSLQRFRPEGRYHFLPVALPPELGSNFVTAALASEDYPNLISSGERVQTVATRSALLAYNWSPSSDRYRVLQTFVQLLFPRLADLQRSSRHPKWREVDPAASLTGWKRFRPAAEWLAKRNLLVGESALRDDFERFLSDQGQLPKTASERERFFKDFLRWREIEGR